MTDDAENDTFIVEWIDGTITIFTAYSNDEIGDPDEPVVW
jgi:hypothetical protein